MTIGEREDEVRPVVRMETNRLGLRGHRDLGSIPPLFQCFNNLGVREIQFPDAPQRITDDRALGCELAVVRDVLQLAAATVIVHVMRAGRRHPAGPRLDDLADCSARIVAVPLQRAFPKTNAITWYGSWDKHDSTISESPDPIASDSNASDGHELELIH